MPKTLPEVGSLAFSDSGKPGAAWEPLLRGSQSPSHVLHSLCSPGCPQPPRPRAQHTKPEEGSKTHVAPTEGLLLSLQEMGIPVPGQSSPCMKERGANQIT